MIESLYYTSTLFKINFALYCIAFLGYLIGVTRKKRVFTLIPIILFFAAFISCSWLIIDRWIDAGRPPFKTFFESLIFAVWTISLISLAIEARYQIKLIGLLASFATVLIIIYALSKRDIEIIALPPALQTWLFIPHVISYFLSYGALFVGGLAATIHLIKPGGIKSHHTLGNQARVDFSDFSYEIIKFGFLFLTAGLLLGAWWGQVAWSNYWGWDPKENWAFISWLIFAAYLHFRNISGYSKKRLSWVIIIGVIVIIFTYLGMDYLPTADDSLHIYSES